MRCLFAAALALVLLPVTLSAQTRQPSVAERYLDLLLHQRSARQTQTQAVDPLGLYRQSVRRPAAPPAYITSNPYLGTPVGQYDSRMNPYSAIGAQNPYTTQGGRIYSQDGAYLGRLNSNRYDPESVANPYGRYGSPYSANSINNPFGRYGSPYSVESARNPYATQPPVVVYPPNPY